jgi:hypothetical protein
MAKADMKIDIRRLPNNRDMFEFTISTSTLRSQFIIPRAKFNQLRIMIEKVLTKK